MSHILSKYDEIKYFSLAIVKRRNWFLSSDILSAKLNGYLNKKYKVRICQMNGHIMDKHLENDDIHFNAEGYKLFISKGLGPLLDDYHMSLELPKKRGNLK